MGVSKFFFNLDSIKPQESNNNGKLTFVTSDQVPGFINMSFSAIKLAKNGSIEPMWHPNANKVGYCVGGEGVVAIRTPGSVELFTIGKGDIFFIPEGYVHHVMNNGNDELNVVFALNTTKPEIMVVSKSLFSLSDEVFKQTFKISPELLQGLKKAKKQGLIQLVPGNKTVPVIPSSPYKFNLAASDKYILTKGGYVQAGLKPNLPVLNGLGILGFGLNPQGAVEPHWHTNAGELIYILKGKTQITVLAPDGSTAVMEVGAGQGAFAAASHFHNILNIGDDEVEVMAFFSNDTPDYIGIGEVIGSYSNDVLGSIFNVSPSYFDELVKPKGPQVIVPV